MRIGIDASGTFGWRGPSRNIKNLIRTLVEIDEKNHYFLFVPNEPTFELKARTNFTWIIVKKKRFVPWLNVSLPLSVIKHKLDVFIFPQANFWIWKPIKTIIFTRYAAIIPYFSSTYEKIQVFFRKIRFNCIADRVVCVSHFNSTQIQLTCGISEDKMVVIYNGVDPVFLDKNIPHYSGYGKYILCVGGTENRKNILRLIEAFKILVSKGIKENLVLVGGKYTTLNADPDMNHLVNEQHRVSGRVILHGIELDSYNLSSLYKGAQIVVYPTLQEDFGLVSVEAMASGCPLVASWMPSVPEIAGDAAEYFDPYDVEEMAEKIGKVLKDAQLRASLISKGKERIKRFSWETSARKLLDLIEDVARTKKTHVS